MKLKILALFILIFSQGLYAQDKGYDIQFNLKNFQDTVSYLAQYYGDQIVVKDTARVNQSQFAFTGDSLLPAGMYVIAGQSNNKIMDLLINRDQQFSISFTLSKMMKTLTIKGSKENNLFYEYVKEISAKRKRLQKLKQSGNPKAQQKIKSINQKVEQYQKDFIKENQGTFTAAFIKASREIEVPKPKDKSDSTFQFHYYKKHYWDNMPLSDPRMLRTPLFHDRYKKYLDKVVPQHPDSIAAALDRMLNTAPDSSKLFEYILWKSTRKYERSKIMGFDAVFTHLALNYFKKGRTGDLNEQVVKNIVEKGEKLKNLLIGKKAPGLVMMDTARNPVSLHDIKADYTILIFWDSNCGHCQKEIPKLHKFYRKNREKWNLATYAVSTDTSVREWKNFINKHDLNWTNVYGYWSYTKNFHDLYDINTTPVLYLLDKEKKIIGKRILTRQVKKIIRRRENQQSGEGRIRKRK
ncbi:MAG: redoxin domain-containing protein [Bacteroidales bacterium]|nr:redoxin domain-containing protein [Bacteroidales bacterium]MCF8334515.1 redoxin domain-containing protein [Bacteroidales bacterium]